LNYLRPDINKDQWCIEEDMKILELINKHGTQWKVIQQEMPNRTDNQIKNRYYGRLKLLLKRKARALNKK
jgi:myb proto-oncogene protein